MTTRVQGSYLRFFVHEDRRHHGRLLYEWLLERAKQMGIQGGTAFRTIASYGSHGVLHEQRFFELAGSVTVRVDFVVSRAEADRLIALLEDEQLAVFYAEMPATFGVTGAQG